METQKPQMHCHNELLKDIQGQEFISDEKLMMWFNDRYSTSKHLLSLYSLARGLGAQNIVEIGFGRSSFVLARAAYENSGRFITCDIQDFSYLLSKDESAVTEYVHGLSEQIWCHSRLKKEGIDFAFLDFFSGESVPIKYCTDQIMQCFRLLKENGVIAIHDVTDPRYPLKNAIKKIAKKRGVEYVSLPYNYGLGLLRRTKESKFGAISEKFQKKIDSNQS